MSEYKKPDYCDKRVEIAPIEQSQEQPKPQSSRLGTGLMFICWGLLFGLLPLYVKLIGLSFYEWTSWMLILIGFMFLFLGVSGACMELNK